MGLVILLSEKQAHALLALADEPYAAYNNYSYAPFPNWTVPAMDCLPRGLEIIHGEGVSLQGTFEVMANVRCIHV